MKTFEYNWSIDGVVNAVKVNGIEKNVSEDVIEYLSVKTRIVEKYRTPVKGKDNVTKSSSKQTRNMNKEISTIIGNTKTESALKELRNLGVSSVPRVLSLKVIGIDSLIFI